MAESAKILSVDKTVLRPCLNAGCAMADMVDESEDLYGTLLNMKNKIKY